MDFFSLKILGDLASVRYLSHLVVLGPGTLSLCFLPLPSWCLNCYQALGRTIDALLHCHIAQGHVVDGRAGNKRTPNCLTPKPSSPLKNKLLWALGQAEMGSHQPQDRP